MSSEELNPALPQTDVSGNIDVPPTPVYTQAEARSLALYTMLAAVIL